MQLIRKSGVLLLFFPPDIHFSFRESWIRDLQKLPIEKYGEYIKTEIYPFFSSLEQSQWMQTTISNKDLEATIIEYLKNEDATE